MKTQLFGRDINGHLRFLGMKDGDGKRIRYIENRHCWESREERDESLSVGRWSDAVKAWAKAGKQGPIPRLEDAVSLVGALPSSALRIIEAAQFERDFFMPIYLGRIEAMRDE